jgi:hypothetical protein
MTTWREMLHNLNMALTARDFQVNLFAFSPYYLSDRRGE